MHAYPCQTAGPARAFVSVRQLIFTTYIVLTGGVASVVGGEVVDVDEDTGLVLFLRNRRYA